jgi:hypothetical protein
MDTLGDTNPLLSSTICSILAICCPAAQAKNCSMQLHAITEIVGRAATATDQLLPNRWPPPGWCWLVHNQHRAHHAVQQIKPVHDSIAFLDISHLPGCSMLAVRLQYAVLQLKQVYFVQDAPACHAVHSRGACQQAEQLGHTPTAPQCLAPPGWRWDK